jgi:hypothetical protein
MGLSIFYSGRIRNVKSLAVMKQEVQDICQGLQWVSNDFMYWPEIPLNGFQFHPPSCEPVWFTFREDGFLIDPVYYTYSPAYRKKEPLADKFLLNTVTQYAGIEAHMALIKFLRYLSNKYFDAFHLVDESEYWETGNEEKCKDWFIMFEAWMQNMSSDLGKLDGRGYESGEHFQERVEDLIRNGKSIDDILNVMGDPYRK